MGAAAARLAWRSQPLRLALCVDWQVADVYSAVMGVCGEGYETCSLQHEHDVHPSGPSSSRNYVPGLPHVLLS